MKRLKRMLIGFSLIIVINAVHLYYRINLIEFDENIYTVGMFASIIMINFFTVIWFFNGGSFGNEMIK